MTDLPKREWQTQHRRALSATEILENVVNLPGWHVLEGTIAKTFKFNNYFETMTFVNAVAMVAHTQDHHPDMGVHYNRCVVRFHTHDVGGLSDTDFDCAARIEAFLK